MTDRELLEAAAKAMRDSGDPNFRNYEVYADRVCLELGSRRGAIIGYWNPLTNDGDAFSLMVRLGLSLRRDVLDVGTFLRVREMNCGELGVAMLKDDPLAATRRAIVRAAAEIGRSKT